MKNGGPAFPVLDSWIDSIGNSRFECFNEGMTLCDYFAGQALAGYCANVNVSADCSSADIARTAYHHADAMLAEREKQNGGKE